MHLTLWILIIMIALFMTPTEQAVRSTAENSVERKTCYDWIINDGYYQSMDYMNTVATSRAQQLEHRRLAVTNMDYNRYRAETRDKENDYALNIWTRAYVKLLDNAPTGYYLFPLELCMYYKKTNELMENMTPQDTNQTCSRWIVLSGFSNLPLSQIYNQDLAKEQIDTRAYVHLSNCAFRYVLHIAPENNDYDTIRDFCTRFLNIPVGTQVSFLHCGVPIVDPINVGGLDYN